MRLIVILGLVMAGAGRVRAGSSVPVLGHHAPEAKPALRFDYDVGVGERAFQSDIANQPEQRIGVQASQGRLTFLRGSASRRSGARIRARSPAKCCTPSLPPSGQVSLAAGGGVLHEADGVNVLLARMVAGRATDASDSTATCCFRSRCRPSAMRSI